MKPEKQNLIRDLLDEDSNRESTLLAGAGILRRRRHVRALGRGVGVLVIVALAAVFVLKEETPRSIPPQIASGTGKVEPVTRVHELSDDELLALFPNTPVALAPLGNGKKWLIFPRPGDEQKFVTKL